jgi:hypothetical protein
MEGRGKLHTHEYKETTNDWNNDASSTLTSLLVSDLENFQHLIFIAQCATMIKGNTKTVNVGMNLSPQKLITCSSTVHIGICNDCGSVAD